MAIRSARVLAALWLAVCVPAAHGQPCRDDDRACAADAVRAHPVARVGAWKDALARPLRQRVLEASPGILEYLTLDNISEGLPERPRAARADESFRRDLDVALATLPARVLRLAAPRLAGIVLVEQLGGTGYTAALQDPQGNEVAGFVVLDAAVLASRTANQWATWKEGTPFRPTAALSIEAVIEHQRNDTRAQALQYILLHELGHVVSVGAGLHPPWTRPPAPERRPERYRFSRISWTLDEAGSRHVPRRRDEVPRRDDVVYYFGARLDAAHAPQVYAGLASSGFPSLYAATSPGDDFAESFASYVHVVLMRKPWEVRILRGGELLVRLGSCWHEARCAAKRRQLENLLHGPPAGHRTAPD